MKEKINVFLCDVRGTYTTLSNNTADRKESINNFILSLENIINIDKCNNFIFCFVSSDTDEENLKYIAEFKNAIDENNSSIIYCDFENTKIKNEIKLEKILRIIKSNNIRNIYFADDTHFFHKAISKIVVNCFPHYELTRFEIKNGLDELTNKINNYCLLKKENISRAKSI